MSRFIKLNAAGEALPEGSNEGHVITRDTETGLDWDVAEFKGKRMDLEDAKKACADLRTGGHEDWRLPTIKELLTLVDYEKCDPAIDTAFFPSCKGGYYWASTPFAGDSGCAWFVGFSNGYSDWDGVGSDYQVRPCRPSQVV